MEKRNKRDRYFRITYLIFLLLFIALQTCMPAFAADEKAASDETEIAGADGSSNSKGLYEGITEDEKNSIIDEQTNTGEVKGLNEKLKKNADKDFDRLMPGYDPQQIISETAKGKFSLNFTDLINRGLAYLFREIYTNISILLKLVMLVILCAILKNLQTSFLSESVGELAFYACYVVIVTILVVSFNTAMSMGTQVINDMVVFMQSTVPVLMTLMISGGNITSGGVLQPILIAGVEVVANTVRNVFIPLIFLSTILSIVDNISEKVQITKLASFFKSISAWGLGIILTVFIAFVALQGSLGAVVDGVTSKTAKFAIGTFIPVAGKYLADAADTVIGCALLIKNASGLAVMVGIIAICLVPLLKMLAVVALFKITCILIEPISEKRIVNCINEVAGSLTYILGIVASVAFMFLLSVTAVISASNVSAMIR